MFTFIARPVLFSAFIIGPRIVAHITWKVVKVRSTRSRIFSPRVEADDAMMQTRQAIIKGDDTEVMLDRK